MKNKVKGKKKKTMNLKANFFLGLLFLTYNTIRLSYADCSNIHKPSNDCSQRMVSFVAPFSSDYGVETTGEGMTSECCSKMKSLGDYCYRYWVGGEVYNFSPEIFFSEAFIFGANDLWKKCQTIT